MRWRLFDSLMRNSIGFAILLLTIAFSASGNGDLFKLPKEGRQIAPTSTAPWIIKPCSRRGPQGATGFWIPTEEQIDLLETRLLVFLNAHRSEELTPPPRSYLRLYAGFVRDGHRYIYGNFYPGKGRLALRERDQSRQVCDGGPAYWGVVYDPDTGKFSEMAVNPII